MKSTEFLQAAIDVQAERGVTYDKPTGERSMGATVTAFNAITGRDLSEAEGWLLLQTLKDVRQWQNPSKYHHDSALDGVAYSALKAEALSEEQVSEPSHIISDIWKLAPVGATHYTPETEDTHPAFWKEVDGQFVGCWVDGEFFKGGNEPDLNLVQRRPTSTAQ
jgi:hypothetical protein